MVWDPKSGGGRRITRVALYRGHFNLGKSVLCKFRREGKGGVITGGVIAREHCTKFALQLMISHFAFIRARNNAGPTGDRR